MSILSSTIILTLSIVVTYIAAFVDETINISKNPTGLPFGFASFNFLGGSTNNLMFVLDIGFWFLIILIIWKILQKAISKK